MLKFVWLKIERGLRFIGKVQSTILLSIFYFVILGIVAIPYRLVALIKRDSSKKNSYWQPRQVDDEAGLLNQF